MNRLLFALGVAVLLLAPVAALADPVTLTFDELTPRAANGVSVKGVTFGFQVNGAPSNDALYNAPAAAGTRFLQCPCLTGDARGVLTLNFTTPVDSFSFAVALSAFSTLSPGFSVQVFNASLAPFGPFSINTFSFTTYSENRVTGSGFGPVARIVITFNPDGGRFAFDNLTFNPVPEPGALWLTLTGFGGLVGWIRVRRGGKSVAP